jgi:hypothetical protein
MNKKLLYVGGGILLGFAGYMFYKKLKKKKDTYTQAQIDECNKKLQQAILLLRPVQGFDMEKYKKDFMENCLKNS